MDVSSTFSLIFTLILILLITGRYHRSVAALLGALLTIVFGLEYDLFTFENLWKELVSFIDVNAVLLVVGVMILAEAIARSGFFEFIGLSLAKTVGGGFHRVSIALISLTILFSALLSNITTMIIIGALTVSLAKKFEADPTETIIYEAMVTNIGGLMLMISSIPNLIVAAQIGIEFLEFALFSLPLALILSIISILLIYRRLKKFSTMQRKIDVDPWSVVENKELFYRALTIFIFVIILLILQDLIKIPLGLIAFSGAILMLILGGQDPESIFSNIDWGSVFFLTSFYIIVGGLERSGVLNIFAQNIIGFLSFQPKMVPILNIWICGLASSVVDNIPITLTLIPVMKQISKMLNISLKALGWGIVFGANLGGNLTPIGSPSNIIALGILKREGRNITWREWFNLCIPQVVMQLLLASVYVTFLSVII
ncbi:MAG: SLC13 family permease [archaeon GB-1845-036]|nr:SLC13 family permease [Candidatus Culexmicrobium thermophilum]